MCVCKVIDLVKDSPMEAPVSLHPHQAYSVLARACRLLFLPGTSRDALEPCVCQSASACTAIDFFLFEKRSKDTKLSTNKQHTLSLFEKRKTSVAEE